jgi:ABC-type nitrate/sulfonate/bicarbonate transport system ATPase subunit
MNAAPPRLISIRGVSMVYGDAADGSVVRALDDFNLEIRSKEFIAFLGPSGCGKTTLLKIIGGLIAPTDGHVEIDGRPVTGPGDGRAIVFQNFALLPWATVLANITFGLELRGVGKEEREAEAHRLIRTFGLEGFAHSYPRQLSGGMQQRVGLARALAVNPEILLMDEPFSALDAQTRRMLQEELLALLDREPKTVVFVTHSMDEAVRLADRIVLMNPRPGSVKEIIEVPFGHPRPGQFEKDPRYIELIDDLWEALKEMVWDR